MKKTIWSILIIVLCLAVIGFSLWRIYGAFTDMADVIAAQDAVILDMTRQLDEAEKKNIDLNAKLDVLSGALDAAHADLADANGRIAAADEALSGILESLQQFGAPAPEAEAPAEETDAAPAVEEAVTLPDVIDMPAEEAAPTCFYNPEGGTYYHADANCPVISPKYRDALAEVPLADMGAEPYAALLPCTFCYPAAE